MRLLISQKLSVHWNLGTFSSHFFCLAFYKSVKGCPFVLVALSLWALLYQRNRMKSDSLNNIATRLEGVVQRNLLFVFLFRFFFCGLTLFLEPFLRAEILKERVWIHFFSSSSYPLNVSSFVMHWTSTRQTELMGKNGMEMRIVKKGNEYVLHSFYTFE